MLATHAKREIRNQFHDQRQDRALPACNFPAPVAEGLTYRLLPSVTEASRIQEQCEAI
jgi:hypothetical protein